VGAAASGESAVGGGFGGAFLKKTKKWLLSLFL
jgi:hypothetical protein